MTVDNQTYCGDDFEVYRNIKSLCCVPKTNMVQVNYMSKTTNLQKKNEKLVVSLGEGLGQEEEVKTYKISVSDNIQYQGCNVQCDKYN